jgi:hypothetical protein
MKEFARTPERVFDKVRECRYYLVQIGEFERLLDTEKFLFSLSAFLSAFRTTAYRLYGVVEFHHGKAAKQSVKERLHSASAIEFLFSRGITETHGDGAVVFHRYAVSSGDSNGQIPTSRWARGANRWNSRYESRWPTPKVRVSPVDWQFQGRAENLVALCHDALTELESIVRDLLAASSVHSNGELSGAQPSNFSGTGLANL